MNHVNYLTCDTDQEEPGDYPLLEEEPLIGAPLVNQETSIPDLDTLGIMDTYVRDNGITREDLIDMMERLSSSIHPADLLTLKDEREATLEPSPVVTPPAFTAFNVNPVDHHPIDLPVVHYLPKCDQWSRAKGQIHEPSALLHLEEEPYQHAHDEYDSEEEIPNLVSADSHDAEVRDPKIESWLTDSTESSESDESDDESDLLDPSDESALFLGIKTDMNGKQRVKTRIVIRGEEAPVIDVSSAFIQAELQLPVTNVLWSRFELQDELHPALIDLPRQYSPECGQVYMANQVTPTEPEKGTQKIVISLCDGIGGCAESLKFAGVNDVSRYIGVEIDAHPRMMAQHAHPKTETFPGVDHTIKDIFDIDEAYIASFPKNSIFLVAGGGECKDFSRLRNLPPGIGYMGLYEGSVRPGLKGPSGKTVMQIVTIIEWVLKHHPAAKYFMENVDFSDLTADWAWVQEKLGTPLIVPHGKFSTTKRKRAYWHNDPELASDPDSWILKSMGPIEPDTCMDQDRTIIKYIANGVSAARPLTASWFGDPNDPTCMSKRKNMVRDYTTPGKLTEIRPLEAERLMGWRENSTKSPSVTNLTRMRGLGNSWDIHVTGPLLKKIVGSSESSAGVAIPEGLSELTLTPEQSELLARGHQILKDPNGNFNQLTETEQAKLVTMFSAVIPEGSAPIIAYTGSVIDSGAGRHVCSKTKVTDATQSHRLRGFDGSTAWTSGRGFLPTTLTTRSGSSVNIDVDDVDHLPAAAAELLSMGKLIEDGWEFRLKRGSLQGTLPGGAIVTLELSPDKLLILPHTVRKNPSNAPSITVGYVKANTSDIELSNPYDALLELDGADASIQESVFVDNGHY